MKVFDAALFGADALGRRDSSRAIQDAIDAALRYDGGGVVLLRSGYYLIGTTLVIEASSMLRHAGVLVRIVGAGRAAGSPDRWDREAKRKDDIEWIGPATFLRWTGSGRGPLMRIVNPGNVGLVGLNLFAGEREGKIPEVILLAVQPLLADTGFPGRTQRLSLEAVKFLRASNAIEVQRVTTELSGLPLTLDCEQIGFAEARSCLRIRSDGRDLVRARFVSARQCDTVFDIDGAQLDLDTANFTVCGKLQTLRYGIRIANSRPHGMPFHRLTHTINNMRYEGSSLADGTPVPSPLLLSVEDSSSVVCNGFGEAQAPLPSGGEVTPPVRIEGSDVTFQQSIFMTSKVCPHPRALVDLQAFGDVAGVVRFRDTSWAMARPELHFGDIPQPGVKSLYDALVLNPRAFQTYFSAQRCTRTGGRILANESNWPT